MNHSMYERVPCPKIHETYYESIEVNVNESGMYTVLRESDTIISIYLYQHEFYPSAPFGNLISNKDNGCHGNPHAITRHLMVNIRYILVVTTCFRPQIGDFSIRIFGKSNVSFHRISKSSLLRKREIHTLIFFLNRSVNIFYFKIFINTYRRKSTICKRLCSFVLLL